MNKEMKQSIIILYHKNRELFYLSLKTLISSIPNNIEVIIVANNRQKAELNLSINDSRITIIQIERDLLYSEAANIGVESANGEIITLCDQDLFYEKNWYQNMLEYLQHSEIIGAVGAKLLNPRNNRIIDFGIAYSPQTIVHPMRGLMYNHPLTMHNYQVSSFCGAILMTKKETYLKAGGMDKTMPYICCDCDFCIQLLKQGLQSWVIAGAVAYHIGSSSSLNSKISSYNYMRGDSKAMFYAKDYTNIPFDIEQWMQHTTSYYKVSHPIEKSYYFFDLSSISDSFWYIEKIEKLLGINYYNVDKINVGPIYSGDVLQLYNFMPLSMLNSQRPIIYFVNSFVSLKDNAFWWKMRYYKKDIVIDTNGNIVAASDIVNMDR